jgi:uncharacterized protein (TIGR02246 family)
MKRIFFCILFSMTFLPLLFGQGNSREDEQKQAIYSLIDQYSLAREKKDTVLLKSILTADADQLVSTGEWRVGIREAVKGMLRSSERNPGSRKLIVEKIRFLDSKNGVADARYEIQNPDGTKRRMRSTFIVVYQNGGWKIAAIRNMLPTSSQ